MNVDSRSLASRAQSLIFTGSVYVTSDANGQSAQHWIQDSISRQVFNRFGETLLDGIYVQTARLDMLVSIPADLEMEFAAWESASDEALLLFEDETE